MQLLLGHDDVVADWAAERLPLVMLNPHRALGVIDPAGVLRGALVLEQATESTVEVIVVSEERAITPGIAKAFFRLVFGAGIWRLQARTGKGNKSVKRALPKMGFRFEGVARDYWGPGTDALLYSMTADQCRWTHG